MPPPASDSGTGTSIGTPGGTAPAALTGLKRPATTFVATPQATTARPPIVAGTGAIAVATATAESADFNAPGVSRDIQASAGLTFTSLPGTARSGGKIAHQPASVDAGVFATSADALLEFAEAGVSSAVHLTGMKVAHATAQIAVPLEMAAKPHVWLQLAELDATVFSDSLRAFASESASLETIAGGFKWSHPLSVAAGAMIADSIIVGYWWINRSRRREKTRTATVGVINA